SLPAWALVALAALVYLIAAPPSTDLAAAAYRSEAFAKSGFGLWDNAWYAGHDLPAYSVLAPALGSWIGPQLVAALAMVAATVLSGRLIAGLSPGRAPGSAPLGSAVGAAVSLPANRVPFAPGLALGLGSFLPARRERYLSALTLAVLTPLASPVA